MTLAYIARSFLGLAAAATLSCSQCSVEPPLPCPRDAAGNPIPCTTDAQCQDGNFCDGSEQCMPGAANTNECGCLYAVPASPCRANEECLEESARCVEVCTEGGPDADGDGHRAASCGGDDCDDADAARFPGNVEVCDVGVLDEDCNPTTFGDRDDDRDGFIDSRCCNDEPGSGSYCGNDCADNLAEVHPGLAEVCNGLDDNCNADVDEAVTVAVYPDADGDGHGAGAALDACADSAGYSPLGNDCDDTNAALLPGAMRCTGVGLSKVEICGADGAWTETFCGANEECIAQPNGTGVCQ